MFNILSNAYLAPVYHFGDESVQFFFLPNVSLRGSS